MAKLSDEARAFFRECGRKGGKKGNHASKGLSDPLLREAIAEINRTRRTAAKHADTGCWCDSCRRYFIAKQKLKDRKESKS